MRIRQSLLSIGMCLVLASGLLADGPKITLKRDDPSGRLTILIDGRTALVYQYAETLDLPHYWPMNSPSGKNMLVQKTEPYPHHRSFWFADTVRLKGERKVSTYNAFYSGQKKGENEYGPPFKDRVRHLTFTRCEVKGGHAVVEANLVWEMDENKPILDEERRLLVRALGLGEYLLELTFTLTASHGEVEFVSDAVHYAWPYLRLQTRFSGEDGGTILSSKGASGQEATNGKVALWMDYFNTIEGVTEGMAVFQMPDGLNHCWLTREYGCFGPRRPDDKSGKPFILKKGESITQRVGILVHRGDVKTGRVDERYKQYIIDDKRSGQAQMRFVENTEQGTLTVLDGGKNVLTYCFGDQLKEGVDPKYMRSCYIHPLFSMDGQALSEDFPKDHLHHRGLFWTWPKVKTRGFDTQTWHPATPSLRQHFVRWVKRDVEDSTAVLSVENTWKLDGKEVVAVEIVTLHIHPADDIGRAIDLELNIRAVGGPLELQGAPDQNKGYGGLCFRGSLSFTGAKMTTDQGVLGKDSTNVPFQWVDLSTEEEGVAIFVSPDHPGFPTTWLIRNSYAGVINASWPGLKPAVLKPDKPVSLRYRIYIHRGDAAAGRVCQAYQLYLASNPKKKNCDCR